MFKHEIMKEMQFRAVWWRSKLMKEQRSGNCINIESRRTMTVVELKKMIVTIS